MLHFKESWNLIGQQHFGPKHENQNFTKYGIGDGISITIFVIILDYFQEKAMKNFFNKKSKKPHFGPFFPQIWEKMQIVIIIYNITIINHLAKNQKKLVSNS